ncbi:MAG: hypothetical protein N2039_05025 [Gemmataceae bacterium]|nr:hypothetical protein [Gemmataceae bacterium]
MPSQFDASGLQLREIPHPLVPRSSVRVFPDAESACRHLRDHLLTAPECYAWALICPDYDKLLDVHNADARFQYWQEAQRTSGVSAQPLYDLYCRAIRINAEDAQKLGWHVGTTRCLIALGTDGVLLIISNYAVTTAFVPGQGTPDAVREQRNSNSRGLPRERGMRSGRPNRSADDTFHLDRLIRERREASWSRDQRLYYYGFRPAVQFLRRFQRIAPTTNGDVAYLGYEAIKRRIPRLSQLKWPNWQDLRRQCGREDHHG